MLLSLPVVSPDVPCEIVHGRAAAYHLQLAMAMSQAGLIRQSDLAGFVPGEAIPVSGFIRLLDEAWQRKTEGLFDFECLRTDVYLATPSVTEQFCIGIDVIGHENIVVGPLLTALSTLHPDLGGWVMSVLDEALYFGESTYTPPGAFDMAQYLYWEGEVDEKWVKETYGTDAEDVPTTSDLFGHMPKWATTPPKATALQLRNIAQRFQDTTYGVFLHQVSRLAYANQAERRLYKKTGIRQLECIDAGDGEMGCIEPLAALYWQLENDRLYRVFDDNFQLDMQAGKSSTLGGICFEPTKDGLLEVLSRMQRVERYLKELDKTLALLKKHEDEQEANHGSQDH